MIFRRVTRASVSDRSVTQFPGEQMTCFRGSRVLPALTLIVLSATAIEAGAQTCRGMPRGGGIAYVRGDQFTGSTNGIALSKGFFGLGFNSLSENMGISGWDANLRLTMAFGSKLQICPALGLEFAQDEIESLSKVTSRTGTASAGIHLGFEQEVTKGLSVIPFIGVDYQFTAIAYSLEVEGDDDEISGDTLSHANLTAGALARYKSFFAGLTLDRDLDEDGGIPYRTRLLIGFAFGAGGRSSYVAPLPRR
jgi:hypothetical protein